MKSLKPITFLFFIAITVLLNSCSNEPIDPAIDPTDNNGGSTYYVKFKMDGVQKTYTITQVMFVGLGPNGTMTIIGSEGLNSISLHIIDEANTVVGTGTFPLEWTNVGCDYTEGSSIFASDYDDFTTSAGNIVITEKNTTNKTVKGTFNFIGKNSGMTQTRNFTEGDFFVRYE